MNILYRYLGVIGLQLIFCWFFLVFSGSNNSGIPEILGSFTAIFLISFPIPLIIFFLNLIIGKKVNHLLIFLVFLICSIIASTLVILGEL